MDRILNTPQASDATGLAVSTLRKRRMDPNFGLKFVKIGRRVGYRPCDIEAFLEGRLRASTSSAT